MAEPRIENTNRQELVVLPWHLPVGDRFCLTKEHAENADGGTQTNRLAKADRRMVIDKVRYVNPTGLAAHADNFATLSLKQSAVTIASFLTDADGGGAALVANTYVDLTLSATAADLIVETNEILDAVVAEAGTTTVPPGRFEVYGRYVADDVDFKLWKARRQFCVDKVELKLLSGLAANNTNYYVFQLKNGSSVVAEWDTRAAGEGALTADTFGEMDLSDTATDLLLAAGDTLTLSCNETGDAVLSDIELVVHGRYL